MRTDQTAPPRTAQVAAQLAFLLLFPGFFFYHSALGLGYSRAFLGGYFTPVALLVALPLLLRYRQRLRRDAGPGAIELAYFGFLLYAGAMLAVQVAAGANLLITRNDLLFLLQSGIVFMVFRLLDFSAASLRRQALACLLTMSAIVFAFSEDGVFYLAALGRASAPEAVATYQGFSRSYLFVYLVVITQMRTLAPRLALYLLAAVTLYVNGARSEFVAMLCTIPLLELYRAQHRALTLLLLCAGVLLLTVASLYIAQYLPDNRTLELLDLSQSTSATLRHTLTRQALATIAQHPLLGAYGSYEPGSYAHNILSAWIDLGLFGFVFLAALLLWPMQRLALQCFLWHSEGAQAALPLCLCSTTVLLLLGSHHYHDMFIAATLGSYGHYLQQCQSQPDRAPQFGASAS